MKRVFTAVLALALAVSLVVPAFAENAATNTGERETEIAVSGNYASSAESPVVLSVDIVWGDLTFTYQDGDKYWDTDDLEEKQKEGQWQTEPKSVTVTNHSNAAISANFSFAAEVTGIVGTFTQEKLELVSAEGTTLTEAPQGSVAFRISGSKISADQQIGTLTVTVKKYSTAPQTISTLEELRNSVDQIGFFRLANDLDLDMYGLVITSKDYTLDLNGHTLSGSDRTNLIINNGVATIKNGTITSEKSEGIWNSGSLTAENLTVNAATKAIHSESATKTELTGCTLIGTDSQAVYLNRSHAKLIDCTATSNSLFKYAVSVVSESGDPTVLTIGGNTVLTQYLTTDANPNPCTVVVEAGSSFDPTKVIDTSFYTITDNGDGTWTLAGK